MGDLSLKCRCGAMQAIALDLPKNVGARIICYCDDCQAAAHYVGQAETILDGHGGTEILSLPPSQFRITQGLEHLKCFRLSEKGLLRWYAGCCRTSLANSPPTSKMPYMAVINSFYAGATDAKQRDALLTPISFRVMGKHAIGQPPRGTAPGTPITAILAISKFLLIGYIQQKQKPSALFNVETGQTVVKPYVLTSMERQNLRRKCGPNPHV